MIGADTEVAVDGRVLGKPRDRDAARAMLEQLSGREHEVHGGLAVVKTSGTELTAATVTTVRFARIGSSLLDAYLAAGAWRGFAGGYAIQGLGSVLVDAVRGELANVIGLSLRALAELAPEIVPTDGGGRTP